MHSSAIMAYRESEPLPDRKYYWLYNGDFGELIMMEHKIYSSVLFWSPSDSEYEEIKDWIQCQDSDQITKPEGKWF